MLCRRGGVKQGDAAATAGKAGARCATACAREGWRVGGTRAWAVPLSACRSGGLQREMENGWSARESKTAAVANRTIELNPGGGKGRVSDDIR